jgi:FSR family fosmidomycin resistance protein-like MFS transporter
VVDCLGTGVGPLYYPTVGVGLALLFACGALGEASCGWLGQRLGVVSSVVVTKAVTALVILATLILPLASLFVLLPLLGVVLNGTSSIH